MELFKHKKLFDFKKLPYKNSNGRRLYESPSGKMLPSITSILGWFKKDSIQEWRKRVGEEEANKISTQSSRRGTAVHQICEDYLNNMSIDYPEKWKKHEKDFLPLCLFNQLRDKVLDNISEIYAQECGLYSDKYRVAGRVDCIAKYKGVLSIIDFKTSTKERSDAWNENYYIQGSAYAEMFTELTGIDISQVVILVVTEDGTVQEFIKDKSDFLDALTDSVAEWRKQNETDELGKSISK